MKTRNVIATDFLKGNVQSPSREEGFSIKKNVAPYIEKNRYKTKQLFNSSYTFDLLGNSTVEAIQNGTKEYVKAILKEGKKHSDAFIDILKKEDGSMNTSMWTRNDLQTLLIKKFNQQSSVEDKKTMVSEVKDQSNTHRTYIQSCKGPYSKYAQGVLKAIHLASHKERIYLELQCLMQRMEKIQKSSYWTTHEKNLYIQQFLNQGMGKNFEFLKTLEKRTNMMGKIFHEFLKFSDDQNVISEKEFSLLPEKEKERVIQSMEKNVMKREIMEAEMKTQDSLIQRFLEEENPKQALFIAETVFRRSLALQNIELFSQLKKDAKKLLSTTKNEALKQEQEKHEEEIYMTDEEAERQVVNSLEADPMSRIYMNVLYAAMCAAYKSYGSKHFYNPSDKNSDAIDQAKQGRKEWFYDEYNEEKNNMNIKDNVNPNKGMQSIDVHDTKNDERGRVKKVNLNPHTWNTSEASQIEIMSNNLHDRNNTLVSVFYNGKTLNWKTLGKKMDTDLGKHLRKHYLNPKLRISQDKRNQLLNNSDNLWKQEWSSYTSWKIYTQKGKQSNGNDLKNLWSSRLWDKTKVSLSK